MNKQQASLGDVEMEHMLSTVPHWRRDGQKITREFKFSDFPAAIQFVNSVAELAEQASHHPDIAIHWNRVILSLTTHSQGGLTKADFDLAAKIDQIVS